MSPQNAMSELVTWVFAALNGFCAVWKFAKNQKFWPNGCVERRAELVRVVRHRDATRQGESGRAERRDGLGP